jgi:hypothetical protein
MDPLDQPINLHMKNGKVFPTNVVFMGYIILGAAVFAFLMGSIFIGIGGLLIACLISFTTTGTKIRPETFRVEEYTRYLGFIPISKSFDYQDYSVICVVPTRETNTMYSRNSNSMSYVESYYSICLLNQYYRSRKDIARFERKDKSTEVAKMLAHIMELEYFEYDPKVIRQKMLGR